MFNDRRSRKVLFVAHCILNQNAKVNRCAHYPGAVTELAQKMIDAGYGLIQLPCPELLCLGLQRGIDLQANASVEEEDTRIARLMDTEPVLKDCARWSADIVRQVKEYRESGFEVAGLVGINGSPTCAVERTWFDGQEQPGPGVFIRVLQDALRREQIELPMRGVKVYQIQSAMTALADWMQ